jgi:hypothetical protein
MAGAVAAIAALFLLTALQPIPPEQQARGELLHLLQETGAQRALLAKFEGRERISVVTLATPGSAPILASNLVVRLDQPGYRDLYRAHLRGDCWQVNLEDAPPDSTLEIGMQAVEAVTLVSCPVGKPLRGAISLSFDYEDADIPAAKEAMSRITPKLEALLTTKQRTP